ncbi:NAD(P)H-hydrate epimerase [Smittium culicis]|uniref:NAD(P)H-hydrate epimerase n=1 Tax=Smittium culicis TaxID=133412 RepID=A0A1R1X1B0_9FUNG|nr:NAD(P)H-hydrate epimerase [Smittium culicis]
MSILNQRDAIKLDIDLMSDKCGFVLEQLMELAGFSVAQAISKVYPKESNSNILLCIGPGNNGGDGLVAARHLSHFGYKPKLMYPKPPKSQVFRNLLQQCSQLDIPIVEILDLEKCLKDTNVVVDALFGFGFKSPVREPFVQILDLLAKTSIPIASSNPSLILTYLISTILYAISVT